MLPSQRTPHHFNNNPLSTRLTPILNTMNQWEIKYYLVNDFYCYIECFGIDKGLSVWDRSSKEQVRKLGFVNCVLENWRTLWGWKRFPLTSSAWFDFTYNGFRHCKINGIICWFYQCSNGYLCKRWKSDHSKSLFYCMTGCSWKTEEPSKQCDSESDMGKYQCKTILTKGFILVKNTGKWEKGKNNRLLSFVSGCVINDDAMINILSA